MRWQVDRYELAEALERRALPAGWLTAREASEQLGVSQADVVARIEAGYLPGRKHNGQWIVEEAAVKEQAPPAGWIDTGKAAEVTRMAPSTIIRWIQEGRIRGRKLGGRWFVEEAGLTAQAAPPWPSASDRASMLPLSRVQRFLSGSTSDGAAEWGAAQPLSGADQATMALAQRTRLAVKAASCSWSSSPAREQAWSTPSPG